MKRTLLSNKYWLFALMLALLTQLTARAQMTTWQTAVPATPNPAPSIPVGANCHITERATASNGDIYIVGYFDGTASFGSRVITSVGGDDLFIAKWRPSASSFIWVEQAGDSYQDQAHRITISGNALYVAGTFMRTVIFGANSVSSSFSRPTMFITKLTDTGTSASFNWAQSISDNNFSSSVGKLIVVGSDVYITGSCGSYGSTVRFGNILVTPTPSVGNYMQYDAFIAKLTDTGNAGNFVWATSMGGDGADNIADIALSGGNLYVYGSFNGLNFTVGNVTLTNSKPRMSGVFYNGTSDMFVANFVGVGNSYSLAWTQKSDGLANEVAGALAVDGANIYLTGYFESTAGFGNTSLISSGLSDVVVAKLVDNGPNASFIWAQKAGGAGNDSGSTISTNTSNGVITLYVGGSVVPVASFGSLSIASPIGTATKFEGTLTDASALATAPAIFAGLTLSPNPTHGRTTVQLPPGLGSATLTVLDALGRPLRTQTVVTNTKVELDLTGMAPGLYAVRVAAGGQVATQKLVVE